MTALLERDFSGNERNLHFIVNVLIAYLLIYLFITLYIFQGGGQYLLWFTFLRKTNKILRGRLLSTCLPNKKNRCTLCHFIINTEDKLFQLLEAISYVETGLYLESFLFNLPYNVECQSTSLHYTCRFYDFIFEGCLSTLIQHQMWELVYCKSPSLLLFLGCF